MDEDKPHSTSQRTEQRGRKRNDALPPSRAREVQRAFRARRAAHLAALEERVKEVETENAELREALHMPPANRPAIRSGPTGRGKVIDTPGAGSSSTVKMDGDFSGSESGSVDSHGQNTPDAHDGGGNKSRKRHASTNSISRPGSAANDFSPLNSVDAMFNSSRSNGNGGVGGGSNNGSGSRLPYGFNMFPGANFSAGLGIGQGGGGDQRLPFSMNGAGFPSSHLGGGGSPRPEDVLSFQQQLNQHQQNQLNAFSSNNNNNSGNNNNNNSLPPSNMYPSTLMNLPGSPQNASSPYAAQYQHQLAQQQTYHNLMQQQQQQQPERPLSSNSQHTNNGSGNGDGHPSFPLQNHHRQPSSQHSSPLANGFPSYPQQQQQVSTPGGSSSFSSNNNNNNNAPSRSGTPNFQQQMGRSAAGTPSGRIEIGSAQAYSVMDRLKACCKLDDQAVSSDPGLLAFCNDIVTSLGAQPSDCLLPPSPAPPTPSPTASPASHPSTPNPSSVLSAAHLKSGLYLPIFNVWSVLRQSYPLPFEAAVRDAMEAGSRAAKALLKAAAASSVKVENWKGGKGSYGEKIVCRNSNGVEVERGFLEVYMASLVDGGGGGGRKSGLLNGNGGGAGNGNGVGGVGGAGGAVLGSWGGPGVGTPEMKLESGVGGDGVSGGGAGEGL